MARRARRLSHKSGKIGWKKGVVVSSTDRWARGNICYSHGWALGRLTYFDGAAIEEAFVEGDLLPGDILLTDAVPASIPVSVPASVPASAWAALASASDPARLSTAVLPPVSGLASLLPLPAAPSC